MKTVASPAARLAIALALVGWILVASWPPSRPSPSPVTAPASDFSAGRAMVHIDAIAQRPHPVGSAEHARVRDYILAQLANLRVESQLQTGTGKFAPRWSKGRMLSGEMENVLARLPGTANTRPVLLLAHYDTVRVSPGAADNGHAVACLLETLRALLIGARVRNDVILLFSDGEEKGLLGAALFQQQHPWGQQPGLVVNLEAGGMGGRPFVLETTRNNLWLVRELRGLAGPRGDSLTSELYGRLPSDTDLSVFRRAGLPGMNLVFFDRSVGFYHTPNDRIADLDRSSVEEQGRATLALARHFGAMDLGVRRTGDAVYFPAPVAGLVAYPLGWAAPLAALALVALGVTGWFAWRRRVVGAWMAAPLGLLVLLQLTVAFQVPTASYALTWPALAGVLSFAAITGAPPRLAPGWRLAILLAAPAVAVLVLVPLIPVGIAGLRRVTLWAPWVAAIALVVVVAILPQLALLARRREASVETAAQASRGGQNV